jgi:hypothetical protein
MFPGRTRATPADREAFASAFRLMHTVAASRAVTSVRGPRQHENEDGNRMATDYDAPRKTEDDSDSIEALKERVPDKLSGVVDVEDADNPGGFELPGADLSDLDLDVVVLPPQADEFTCVSCFLVKHRSQLDHESKLGPICRECEA